VVHVWHTVPSPHHDRVIRSGLEDVGCERLDEQVRRIEEEGGPVAGAHLREGRTVEAIVERAGKRCATPLLAALVVVESSDIIFAVDSVPAVLSITRTAFVAYSSVVFAVLGLRALYFALEGLVDRFVYLHYGLAAILVFVGAKFMAQGFGVGVPILASLLVIAAAIIVTIVASLIATRGGKHGEGGDTPGEGGTGLGPSAGETDGRKRGKANGDV